MNERPCGRHLVTSGFPFAQRHIAHFEDDQVHRIYLHLADELPADALGRRVDASNQNLKEAQNVEESRPVSAVEPVSQVQLALERTYLAHERTLMAWTRTATSLITFGFTLYKFFEFLQEHGQAVHSHQVVGARTFGMIMIGIGVLTLIIASLQHRVQMQRLNSHYPDAPFSLALLLASLIACLGTLGFISGVIHS